MTATTTETTNLRWSRRRAWLVATGVSSVIALAVATWAVRNPWHLAAAPVVVGVAAVVFVLFVAVTLGFGLSRWTPFWGERGERRELRAVRRGW
jgi:fatty acid desaturase